MLSNQEPPPQLLLCTEPPLTPWDSGQPGNHASSPHSLPQHGLSGQPQQHQQQQQQQQKQQQQNDSQHQPQQQSQQWQQGQQRIQYAGQFNQPHQQCDLLCTLSLPLTLISHPPPSAALSAATVRATAQRDFAYQGNVCDGSTWEQPSHPGKRLKRDPGSSASLITALGSRLPMPSNVLTHSNSNAPAPALAPALALATAIAAAAAAAAPAPAARDKATTPAEAQPMERNFIDALSLSPSSLSLACSLAPPHGPKGESHTGEGAKAGGFVGKVRMGKNVKGESLMGEVVLGEGCSPSARGPSLDLPGFYEPSFPELSLSLGRL
ncbi:unnamed protein product [Closterium sp. NIES-64]|nr:unnamed protein product [Closterium sp. NIES-64]